MAASVEELMEARVDLVLPGAVGHSGELWSVRGVKLEGVRGNSGHRDRDPDDSRKLRGARGER